MKANLQKDVNKITLVPENEDDHKTLCKFAADGIKIVEVDVGMLKPGMGFSARPFDVPAINLTIGLRT